MFCVIRVETKKRSNLVPSCSHFALCAFFFLFLGQCYGVSRVQGGGGRARDDYVSIGSSKKEKRKRKAPSGASGVKFPSGPMVTILRLCLHVFSRLGMKLIGPAMIGRLFFGHCTPNKARLSPSPSTRKAFYLQNCAGNSSLGHPFSASISLLSLSD